MLSKSLLKICPYRPSFCNFPKIELLDGLNINKIVMHVKINPKSTLNKLTNVAAAILVSNINILIPKINSIIENSIIMKTTEYTKSLSVEYFSNISYYLIFVFNEKVFDHIKYFTIRTVGFFQR